ncbi:MAG TPA: phosphomethylpyrimidine synthase, partial [Candidatus Synoicihabitans sp.]|nr:phosphomethylpyrimidine synthase [Candidatus Synoicihabitans sp.]
MPSSTAVGPDDEATVALAGHRLFPASRRVHLVGSRPDLRVPMREIVLSPTRLPNGTEVPNEPVRVYDTSGPWGDATYEGDVTRGLPPVRATWIQERGDVEEVVGRVVAPMDDGYLSEQQRAQAEREGRRSAIKFFDRGSRPILRAKRGRCVTQLAYARAGVVTPEMEFVAIREN